MELDMKRSYNKAFNNTFSAIQCLAWLSLYDEDVLDFDKDKIIAFQKGLTDHNKIIDDRDKYFNIDLKLKEEHGINSRKMSNDFPYISKMKIADFDKRKDKAKATLIGCENALEVFFVIFSYELIKEFNYTKDDIDKCYERMKEHAELYRKGMTNEFVQEFFKDYVDLIITM